MLAETFFPDKKLSANPLKSQKIMARKQIEAASGTMLLS